MIWIYGGNFQRFQRELSGGPWDCREGSEVMFQTRKLLRTVILEFFFAALSHAALLPTSLNISIQSVNMKHTLKWSSLHEVCQSVNYTVKYQGEFESLQNNSWQDDHTCYEIAANECDMTPALSSDSNYNISVLARCDLSTLWTQLPKTFNRRDTVLLAPNMTVTSREGHIDVSFSELQSHISVTLSIWKEGDEENVISTVMIDKHFQQNVSAGDRYCLRAEAKLIFANKTNSTQICHTVQGPNSSWLLDQLLAVGIAAALSLTVALVLGLITPRCSLWLRKSMHHKQPLPNALHPWPKISPTELSRVQPEVETTHSLLLLGPLEAQDGRSETKATCLEIVQDRDTINLLDVKTLP